MPGGQRAGNEGRRALRKGSTGGLCRGVEPSGDDAAVWHRPTESSARRENVIALENGGTGKSHIALGLGLTACQKGLLVGSPPPPAWCTSCSRPGTRSVLRLQRQLAGNKLLVGLPRGAREFLLDVLVVGEIYRMSLLE